MTEKLLKKKEAEFNELLSSYAVKHSTPPIIGESMNYSLLAPAKRIRPILLLEANSICGGKSGDAVPLAAAVEMIHTYSLIHDDLPCMDDDELRRGRPSNHVIYGYPIALLAGDGLLNLAYETILSGYAHTSSKARYISASKEIARAAGVDGMVGGQAADLLSENKDPDEETLRFIHANKTGALIKASLRAGAVLAGADKERLKAVSLYGECVGSMFQIVDDILDVTGDKSALGKNVGKDDARGKMTYTYVYGLQKAADEVNRLNEQAQKSLACFDDKAHFLIALSNYLKMRAK